MKNFFEVVVPARVDDGTMRDDNRFGKFHSAGDFERAKSFAETHFCIPEKFFFLLESFDGQINRFVLFGAENYFGKFFGLKSAAAALDGFNRFNRGVEVDFKPFAAS